MTSVAVYAMDGSATASAAARTDSARPATRRVISHAGIAASDIANALVAFAAPYALGSTSKSLYAGASRIG